MATRKLLYRCRRQAAWLAALALIAFVSHVPVARAQIAGAASIQGTVTDPSGAVIPGAAVTLTQTSTHVERTAASDTSGLYTFPNVPVGAYTLTAKAPNFQTFTQTNIVLEVGSSITINIKMKVGAATQRVEVRSENLGLQTQNPSFKQTIDHQMMVAMPLNGRQMTDLIQYSGGTAPAPGGDFTGNKYTYQTISISVGGGMGNTTMWTLDGGDNNDYMANGNLPFPFPDAVNQFSVQSTVLGAQNSMHSGGMVNVVTRSGTNSYHGSAFEFIRNNYIDATNFFATQPDQLHQNQYGGTFGGPILKNKLFAFAGYQRTSSSSASSSQEAIVPTADNLAGDWSHTDPLPGAALTPCITKASQEIQLHDPLTGAILSGNKYPSQPAYNASAMKLEKFLPAIDPVVDTNNCGVVSYAIPSIVADNQFVTRVDLDISSRDHLFGRYFIDGYQAPGFFSPTNILLTTSGGNIERVQSFTLGWDYTFSARTVNAAHITVLRRRNDRGTAANDIGPADLGITVSQAVPNYFELTGAKFKIGGSRPAHFNDNTLSISDDVTMLRGKHDIVFGGGWVQNQLNISNLFFQNGQFNFSGEFSGNGPAGGTVIGDPNLDFLQGAMSKFVQSKAQQNALRGPIPTIYFQDTYHATPGLTLVGGLRWAPNFMPVDVFNRGVVFDRSNFLANKVSSVFPNAPDGVLFFGDPGVRRQFTKNSPWQFSPNAGFAWNPGGKGTSVLRGGFELVYDQVNFFTSQRNQQNPPFATSITNSPTTTSGPIPFAAPWSAGSITTSPFPQPVVPTPAEAVFFPQSQYIVMPAQFHPSYTEQWTASVQRQLPAGWQLSLDYIGSHTVHAPVATAFDPAVFIPGVWGAAGSGCAGVVMTGPAARPAGKPGTPCSTTANQQQRFALTIANPTANGGNQFLGGNEGSNIINDNAMANYNALVTTIQHRLSSTFSLMANWTWSKCLNIADASGDQAGSSLEDSSNPSLDYGPCGSDFRNIENIVLVTNSNFHLPRLASLLVNHWEFAPLIHIRSGGPFTITSGRDNSLTDQNHDRPNRVAGVPVYMHHGIRSGQGAANRGFLNPTAYAQVTAGCPSPISPATCPGYGTFGNVSRNSVTGPGVFDLDAQISRNFPVYEHLSMTLRLEAFNALNHPNFNNPSASLSSTTFGQISGSSAARVFQGAVKLQF